MTVRRQLSHQAIERDEYFGLLSVADLALITSLRDGMNTLSMEFVLCQDKTLKSPLVLSEFMGTASSFGSALKINPHDLLGVANAINQGLVMSDAEKKQRHEELLTSVKSHTSHTWAKTIVKLLLENIGGEHQAHHTPALDKQALQTAYKQAKKRLMLFDYDVSWPPDFLSGTMSANLILCRLFARELSLRSSRCLHKPSRLSVRAEPSALWPRIRTTWST
jgi:trehalose 6-phosphate synthase/phosphatase